MELTHTQREWLRLSLVPGVGTASFIRLLAKFGSPDNALNADQRDLESLLGKELAEKIIRHAQSADLELQESLMRQWNVQLITMDDTLYPPLLAEIYDPPIILYVRGELREEDRYAVAIVGTRKASTNGAKIAYQLAFDLAKRGITVMSGLAVGIDTAAHKGALDAGGRTIAVLAFGHDQIFPSSNIGLLNQIIKHGCAISTFPMRVRALRSNFPQRNRILSGLCIGTVVVEAPAGSGALITAKYAAEQGREVFAVPGPAGHPNSRGPHELIREGAKLVEGVEDIIVELHLPPALRQNPPLQHPKPKEISDPLQFPELQKDTAPSPQPKRQIPSTHPLESHIKNQLSDIEKKILGVLHSEGSFVDEIAHECRTSIAEALSCLTMLELKGLVRQLPGKRFAIR